jgi:integrase
VRENRINDARDITSEIIQGYGALLRSQIESGTISVTSAQNTLSSINVILEWMRRDKKCWQSPSQTVGNRSTVRLMAPRWLDRSLIAQITQKLLKSGNPYATRLTAMIGIGRELGLRWKETALLDARTAVAQALDDGTIRVLRGTKGGVERTVPCSSSLKLDSLRYAAAIQGPGENLIPPNTSFASFAQSASRLWHTNEGERFHDLRVAYACERYQEITGYPPPILNAGYMVAERDADMAVRLEISRELGHDRSDVLSHYIGGRSL